MSSRLALGTAQFGLDYGINNKRGQIPLDEVYEILDTAQKNDVDILDTATAYGKSEEVLGQYIRQSNQVWKIVSKLSREDENNVDVAISKSLSVLGVKQLYGYLVHQFSSFTSNPDLWSQLETRKKSGDIQKIGFSLYYVQDGESILKENIPVDILQVPFNIFDRRFEVLLPEFKRRNIEIHLRSVFLQGLFFRDLKTLPSMFCDVKSKIELVQNIAKKHQFSIADVCLGFCLFQEFADHIVIGVDGLRDFTDNFAVLKKMDQIKKTLPELLDLLVRDEQILLPVHWKF